MGIGFAIGKLQSHTISAMGFGSGSYIEITENTFLQLKVGNTHTHDCLIRCLLTNVCTMHVLERRKKRSTVAVRSDTKFSFGKYTPVCPSPWVNICEFLLKIITDDISSHIRTHIGALHPSHTAGTFCCYGFRLPTSLLVVAGRLFLTRNATKVERHEKTKQKNETKREMENVRKTFRITKFNRIVPSNSVFR